MRMLTKMAVKQERRAPRYNSKMEEAGNGEKPQQRVAELETQLADSISQYNEQVSKLQNQSAHFQSLLEHSEAERQRLEYSLALAHREGRAMDDTLGEQEKAFQSLQNQLQSRVSKLTRQCQEWKSTLETVQQARAQERTELQQLLSAKEEQLFRSQSQYKELECVCKQLEIDLSQERSYVAELGVKVERGEAEVGEKGEQVLGLTQEVKAALDRERKLQKDLQGAFYQVRTLEGSLEGEKAAHMETKFSSEFTHARIKELEDALEAEKTSHREMGCALEETRHKMGNLLEAEARNQELLRQQMQSKEVECLSLEQQLSDKQAIVADLSHQLQLHKTNFEALKQELTQVRERQSEVERSYGSYLKEIEALLEQSLAQKPPTKEQRQSHITTRPLPSQVVDSLRHTLTDMHNQIENAKSQLEITKQNVSRLTTECTSYKEIVSSRTSAITEAEKRLDDSSREISRLKSELGRCQSLLSNFRGETESLRTRVEREKREAGEEIVALKKGYSTEKEAMCKFLQSLHQQLKSVATPSTSPSRSPSGWNKLSTAVSVAANTLTETLKNTRKKILQLRATLDTQHSTLEANKTMHKEAIAKLTQTLKHSDQEWSQKNSELKNHYALLLSQAEERAQKYQQCADEALQRAEELSASREQISATKQQLESQLDHLQDVHKSDRECLLAAVCLLTGTLCPAVGKIQHLVLQKALLLKQLSCYKTLELQVSELVTSILAGVGSAGHERTEKDSLFSGSKCHPLLQFRKVVIAVLAAKRLLRLHTESSFLFKTNNVTKLEVHIGTKPGKQPPKLDLASWLRSDKVLGGVRESMRETMLGVAQQGGTRRKPGLALVPVRNSYITFLEKMFPYFPHVLLGSGSVDSLCDRLGKGLDSILRLKVAPLTGYVRCTELGEALHTQLTNLVGRLHDGEVERCSLRSQLQQSKADCQQLSRAYREFQQKMESLKTELGKMVPTDTYEAACRDLQQAMEREKGAKVSLGQHAAGIQQLQGRLQLFVQDLRNKDSALTEAVKELSEARLALQQRDQQLKQVERQLQLMGNEKLLQTQQIGEIQTALQQTISEKAAVQELMEQARTAFEQSQQMLTEVQQSGQPVDVCHAVMKVTEEHKSSFPELDSCQLMLQSFVNAHQCALSCLTSLHGQVEACEGHIETLKGELSAACRRQIAEVAAGITLPHEERSPVAHLSDKFIPLRENHVSGGQEMVVRNKRQRQRGTRSAIGDPHFITSQGAKLGAELAKSLNI